jgi:hypothetical protein
MVMIDKIKWMDLSSFPRTPLTTFSSTKRNSSGQQKVLKRKEYRLLEIFVVEKKYFTSLFLLKTNFKLF